MALGIAFLVLGGAPIAIAIAYGIYVLIDACRDGSEEAQILAGLLVGAICIVLFFTGLVMVTDAA